MKKLLSAAVAAMLVAMLGIPAFAAEVPANTVPTEEDSISTNIQSKSADLPEQVPEPEYYPVDVTVKEENGLIRLEKTYILRSSDDPAKIDTSDFTREGYSYTLLDVLKNDQTETEVRDHIEVLSKETDTKDLSEILPLFEATLELTTEDGYTGVLTLDHTSLQVEAAGYKNSTRTVSATRTYPNLSAADLSLIPKTVEESGRTLTLADVQWENAAANTVDGYELAIRYTANATYTGTATSSYATGYIATANYTGELTKNSCDTVIYKVVFSGTPADQNADGTDGSLPFDLRWLLIPGIAAVGAGGFFGYKAFSKHQKKKRGYM